MWRSVSRNGELVVDLSQVTYFDSTALWTLLGVEKIASRQRGCAVQLCGLDTATYAVTGLS
jgi:anti-anti-sigma regulatory factor